MDREWAGLGMYGSVSICFGSLEGLVPVLVVDLGGLVLILVVDLAGLAPGLTALPAEGLLGPIGVEGDFGVAVEAESLFEALNAAAAAAWLARLIDKLYGDV